MAVKLYEMGRLSSGLAAQIAQMPRVAFLLELARYGVPVISLSPHELATDFANACARAATAGHQYHALDCLGRCLWIAGPPAVALQKDIGAQIPIFFSFPKSAIKTWHVQCDAAG